MSSLSHCTLSQRVLAVMAALLLSIAATPALITTADDGDSLDSDPGVVLDDARPEVQLVDFAVRIAARLTEDDRVEFGYQLLDRSGRPGALLLPEQRFFSLGTPHHDWLRSRGFPCQSLPYTDTNAELDEELHLQFRTSTVYIYARIHPTRNRVEFALRYGLPYSEDGPALSDPIFPQQRFFPDDIGHHSWVYSSDILFTVLYGADGFMEDTATMESIEGQVEPDWEGIYEWRGPPAALSECLHTLDDNGGIYLKGDCIITMIRHCRIDRNTLECRNFRSRWPEYAIAIDLDEP